MDQGRIHLMLRQMQEFYLERNILEEGGNFHAVLCIKIEVLASGKVTSCETQGRQEK